VANCQLVAEICYNNRGFAQTVPNRVNVFHVLFRVRGEDGDIIQIDEAYLPLQAQEDNIQRTLKGSRRVRQAERH